MSRGSLIAKLVNKRIKLDKAKRKLNEDVGLQPLLIRFIDQLEKEIKDLESKIDSY